MKYPQHWARRLMKHTLLTVLICVLAAIASADDRPNIVLVMADDHGYGDTGFTGHPFVRTPHLDAMAQADLVSVSTPGMVDHATDLCPRPVVLRRNYADSETIKAADAALGKGAGTGPFRVAFSSGSQGHEADLAIIMDDLAGFLAARLTALGGS